ncbi:MAG: hypothetical protein K0Q73_6086, partial [Paenibacillus sp.]|nr:hypothetical protein [Paenibacillus sp.]
MWGSPQSAFPPQALYNFVHGIIWRPYIPIFLEFQR